MTDLASLMADEPVPVMDGDTSVGFAVIRAAARNALRAELRPLLMEPASFTEAEREALNTTALGRKALRVVAELEAREKALLARVAVLEVYIRRQHDDFRALDGTNYCPNHQRPDAQQLCDLLQGGPQ